MRATVWQNIGKDVTNTANLTEVMDKSGLNFEVVKVPIFVGEDTTKLVKYNDKVATVIKETGEALGIVGNDYQICQNPEAFDFVNYIGENLSFEKAGMTSRGMVYIIGKLQERTILGDTFKPYVIFSNGFNGGYKVRAAISPLRIVCQNQFNIAFRDAANSVSIKHSSTMTSKIEEARKVLRATADYMQVLESEAQKYSGIRISETNVSRILDELFPIKPEMTPNQQSALDSRKQVFLSAYNSDDNQNFKGTMWGMINAASDFYSHVEPIRKTAKWEENRFVATVFDPKALNTFIELAMARAAA